MKAVLRPVTPADTAVLMEIYGSTRADELATTDWDDARKQAFIKQQFDAQDAYYRANYVNARYDLIVAGGKPAGRLYTARWPDEIRIMDIALLPAFRGRGIGRKLLTSLQKEAGPAGRALRIHVERFNPALSLYVRLGFQLVEDRGVYLFLEWTSSDATVASGASAAPSPGISNQTATGDQENTAS